MNPLHPPHLNVVLLQIAFKGENNCPRGAARTPCTGQKSFETIVQSNWTSRPARPPLRPSQAGVEGEASGKVSASVVVVRDGGGGEGGGRCGDGHFALPQGGEVGVDALRLRDVAHHHLAALQRCLPEADLQQLRRQGTDRQADRQPGKTQDRKGRQNRQPPPGTLRVEGGKSRPQMGTVHPTPMPTVCGGRAEGSRLPKRVRAFLGGLSLALPSATTSRVVSEAGTDGEIPPTNLTTWKPPGAAKYTHQGFTSKNPQK